MYNLKLICIIHSFLLLVMYLNQVQTGSSTIQPYRGPVKLKGFLFCLTSSVNKEIIKCWRLKQNHVYKLHYASPQNSTVDPGRSDICESLSEDEKLLLSRFNIHINLDHIWHLNIGFTK